MLISVLRSRPHAVNRPRQQAQSWNDGVRGRQVLPLINLDASTIRVEAGPGAGKTYGLSRRVERIMHPDGLNVHGRDVLVVAFNRVIAKQLRTDITARLETFPHQGEPVIRTIHALCVQVVGGDLRLLLPHEREAMIFDLLAEFPALREQYEGAKRADRALSEHEARHADHNQLWDAARRWLRRHQARLVSDLPGLLLDRLQGGDFAGQRYRHVIVDEFQDLTPGEQQLVFRLRGDDAQLIALGDRRQSIYRFRGNDPLGLANLEELAQDDVTDIKMTECQRCPGAVVIAANRLMALGGAEAMVSVSEVPANLHVVTWPDPRAEAAGMAQHIVSNIQAHPTDQHLVMVTRRNFGYWLRDRIAALDAGIRVELSFSEGLLETWAAREAFLLFCLLADPDRPTWRAWFAYNNSADGRGFKAANRNAGAYLHLLGAARDNITEAVVEALAAEPRDQRRGAGGLYVWDRAHRFLDLREAFSWEKNTDAAEVLVSILDPDRWVGAGYEDAETARLDIQLLLEKTIDILVEETDRNAGATTAEHLGTVAQRLRHQIATREPFEEEEGNQQMHLQVATLWGAKGVTADHVYMLGVCAEALPGERRDEYPGTDEDFVQEQQRLFYVSITRSKRTLVLSRATGIYIGEALRMGLSVQGRGRVPLTMSPFLHQIIRQLPQAVAGDQWDGCDN